ncbi:receptor expression-enhancing protein 1-like isoform X1 [Lethenteron reissneri]|uniref:receptor expression-enhancing protein 1-like isoform X1 n=1 Tax=Lethenteron reissneri TaxID=7753 RepID=UPI002AB5DFD4|nr:receptor expression-enhancing protein 1-like isoform X1 [Lethenteron reissneri]
MVTRIISRLVVLVFGTLYPAYASYKAVKTKNVREYVKWMMYWIVFALFLAVETFTDILVSWLPFYHECKIGMVVWLLSPYTRGSSLLYRKFVHPALASREKEIDGYIQQAKERGYETVKYFGRRGLNLAATAAATAAAKGQGALSDRLRSFSMQDIALGGVGDGVTWGPGPHPKLEPFDPKTMDQSDEEAPPPPKPKTAPASKVARPPSGKPARSETQAKRGKAPIRKKVTIQLANQDAA